MSVIVYIESEDNKIKKASLEAVSYAKKISESLKKDLIAVSFNLTDFSILNNYKVSDIASCYWLVKVDTLKKINLSEKGFAIEVEVLSKFLRNKIEIIEVPIRYEARSYEEGKKIKFDDGIKICIKILKYCKLNILNKF